MEERRNQNLTGKRALVTGAASGIGRAVAREMAARGAHVIVTDIDAEGAGRVAEEIGGEPWVVDLSDTHALERELAERADAEGPAAFHADILVNNAGLQRVAPIHEFDPEAFRLIQRIMVETPFLLIRAALPGMYARNWGRVLNVSSVHGIRASAFKSAYVTAKHAIEGLSKVTALEGGVHGVTSVCIDPGYVRTPLVEKQVADQAKVHGITEEEVLDQVFLAKSAVKRLAEPEEVAALAGWLTEDSAGLVTGASYTMDGGWSAM
ncbi:3-hydroxybutyrate dehydrogenase [Brevibacterium litoralis]|uniref:3-hydroxybutyrate dehydrogenase n=1 Tax=Brevibacterium litoralis TaxID=3138935 RepID=UPI0032EEBE36